MDMLEGNARYVLRVEGLVRSSKGGAWDLTGDSVVFFTSPREREPNDEKNCADTIASVLYGSVSDVSDLDVFVCPRLGTRVVYLQSFDCYDTFFVQRGPGFFGVEGPMNGMDSIHLSPSDSGPFFIFVRSRIRGFEGNYKIGIVE
jgi:hypothetical protein